MVLPANGLFPAIKQAVFDDIRSMQWAQDLNNLTNG